MRDVPVILSTKLKVPVPRLDYIIRSALFEKLDALNYYKITLVQGAAGTGKTTLLASYIRERGLKDLCWISLDEDNNHIITFWIYFLDAVRLYLGELGADMMSSFQNMLRENDIEQLLAILINQLNSERQLYIVLDDFHHIRDASLIKTIEFFIRNSSDNIHLILLTREEPKLYTADLLLAGKLLAIDQNDLKFSDHEGKAFIRKTLKLEFKDEKIDAINRLAEGWIGGAQLIALASLHQEKMISSLKVLNRTTVDYLTKEIFERLTGEEQDFLIKTSILNYFNTDICNQYLSINHSRILLDALEDKKLLHTGNEDHTEMYRYHALLGEFLNQRFEQLSDEEKTDLKLKAADVYEKYGLYEDSIGLLLSIGQFGKAMQILSQRPEDTKVWVYLSRIPIEKLVENRDMTYQYFFYRYCNMEFDYCGLVLEYLGDRIYKDESWRALKFAKAFLFDMNFEIETLSIDEIEALKLSNMTKAIIFLKTASFLHIQNKNKEALKVLERAANLDTRIKNDYVHYFVLGMACQIKEDLGDLLECLKTYEQLEALLSQHPFLAPLKENYFIGIAGVYLKSMMLEHAEDALAKSALLTSYELSASNYGYWYNVMELKVLKGSHEEAVQIIKKLNGFMENYKWLYASSLIKYLLYMGITDIDMMDAFSLSYEAQDAQKLRFDDRLIYARVLAYRGDTHRAVAIMDDLLQDLRKLKIKFNLVEALLHRVNITESSISGRDRLNYLREAIYYAHENKILSPFAFARNWIEKPLFELKSERLEDFSLPEKKFLNELFKLFPESVNEKLLSDRETEVLFELSKGKSNKEIAEYLCISLATVKTHMINIYSKLQVSNRVEAIEKSRKLGYIEA